MCKEVVWGVYEECKRHHKNHGFYIVFFGGILRIKHFYAAHMERLEPL